MIFEEALLKRMYILIFFPKISSSICRRLNRWCGLERLGGHSLKVRTLDQNTLVSM